MTIRVLLVGNNPLKNQGIYSHLATINDLTVIESVTELELLPELCALHQPDLLLINLDSWEDSLISVLQPLAPLNLLGLSPEDKQICCKLIHQRIVNGCLPETSSPELLVQAIRAVADGYTWFSQSLFRQILHHPQKTNVNEYNLSDMDLMILQLVMQEETNLSIAQILGISERTVSNHLNSIYDKLGVVSKVGAALKAERLGLIEE